MGWSFFIVYVNNARLYGGVLLFYFLLLYRGIVKVNFQISEILDKKRCIFSTRIQLLNSWQETSRKFCSNFKDHVVRYLIYLLFILFVNANTKQVLGTIEDKIKIYFSKNNSTVPGSFSVPKLDSCMQEPGHRNDLKVQLTPIQLTISLTIQLTPKQCNWGVDLQGNDPN